MNPKKNVLLLIISSFFFSTLSLAQQSPEPEQVKEKLEVLKNNVNQTVNNIKLQLTPYNVSFPDYEAAKVNFFKNLDASAISFNTSIDTITQQVEKTLSQAYSELRALENNAKSNPIKPMKQLVDDQLARIETLKKSLQFQIDATYHKAIANFISLNGNLMSISKIKPNIYLFRDGGLSTLGAVSIGTLSLGGSIFGITQFVSVVGAISSISGTLGTIASIAESTVIDREDDGIEYFVLKSDSNQKIVLNNRSDVEKLRTSFAQKIYYDCKTAGCAYLLAEGYKTFSEAAIKLNRDIELIDGLRLNKITHQYRTKKTNRELTKMTNEFAQYVPLAKFETQTNN